MLRTLGLTLLCFVLGFFSMVAAAMAFSHGWIYATGLLGIIWMVYFLCQLFGWKLAGNIWLAAFIGFASDVLRELDPFTSPAQADLLNKLPNTWVGTIGLACYFPFVAFLPWLASQLANKLRNMNAGAQGSSNPQATRFNRKFYRKSR